MPATTLTPCRKSREVARIPRHHTSGVAHEVGRRLGCSAIAAQRKIERTRELLEVLPAAAQAAGRQDWLRLWSAKFDVARAAGSGIPFSLAALRSGCVADKEEDLALVAFLAEDTDENLEALRRKIEREIAVKQEELVMVTEELERRRQARAAQP